MTYILLAFATGVMTASAIALLAIQWGFDKLDRLEETEHKRLTDQIEQLETELTEAKRLIRVREEQRDEVEEIAETMDQRITSLKSEVKRLKGYETAVRELNRSVEILADDVPF